MRAGNQRQLKFFRRSPAGSGNSAGWAAVAQRLISNGHSWAQAQLYTLPQIEAFLDAIADEEKAANRMALIISRASQAEGKAFNKMLKEFG